MNTNYYEGLAIFHAEKLFALQEVAREVWEERRVKILETKMMGKNL